MKRFAAVLDTLPVEEQARIARLLVESGLCVHSVFHDDCNGCRERELTRALQALVDLHDHGFTTPTHGLVPNTEDDLWRFAKSILQRVNNERTGR